MAIHDYFLDTTCDTITMVNVICKFEDDARWDEMEQFCLSKELRGAYLDINNDTESEFSDVHSFYFTDANAAFQFKMRFG